MAAARLLFAVCILSVVALQAQVGGGPPTPVADPARSRSSRLADQQSAPTVRQSTAESSRADCRSCHSLENGRVPGALDFLNSRSALSREEWAKESLLSVRCGACHLLPDPSNLARRSWKEAINHMVYIMIVRKVTVPSHEVLQDILHFYYTFSPENLPQLPPDPTPAESPLQFEPGIFGNAMSTNLADRPRIGNALVTDLDHDKHPDVVVSDLGQSAVTWIHRTNGVWREETLARVPFPGHAQVVDTRGDGNLDIVVASLGVMFPSDDLKGSVVLLVNDGKMHFTPRTIMSGLCRVADVEPGDFNGDGRVDFVVGSFGFITQGGIGWLEQMPDHSFAYHPISNKAGVINVIPVDINGDGHLDFIALTAQEYEEVSAFINDGKGNFQEHVLWKAPTPAWGSARIHLVDLNQDGKVDILYCNGDVGDLPTVVPRPYDGVAWLENKGNLNFEYHDLGRIYGAYDAVAGDLKGDGNLDIIVTTLFNDWSDPNRASLLWLENDGKQNFARHTIAVQPIHLISAAIGDLDGDGKLDVITCGMNVFGPLDRMARLTLWRNLGRRP